MIVKSIRGRIQLWHTTLLAVLMAGLLSAFYIHEKEIREREFDHKLMAPLSSSIPHFGADAAQHPAPMGQPSNQMGNQRPMRGPGSQGGSASMDDRRPMHGPGPMNRPRPADGQRPMRGPGSMDEQQPMPPQQGGMTDSGAMSGPSMPGPSQATLAERQAQVVGPIMEKGFYIASVTNTGEIVYSSSNVRDDISYPAELIEHGRQDTFIRTENGYREAIHRGPPPAYSIVVIGAPTDIMYAELATLRWQLLGFGLVIVISAYLIGWLLVSRSLMPIQSISQTAAHIADGHLYDRIDIEDTETELGQMGEVLNNTFEKLENAFDQQVRFTADASHELRTPIAVILAKCQFAMMRDREPEKYKETIATCEASAQHIRGLVESLLELARVDSGEFKIMKRESDLATVADSCTDLLSTLADEKQIQVTVENKTALGQFDPDRIHQVVINLLSNAIKYTQNCGLIKISTALENASCVLRIEDTGPGISPDHLPHLFDRFYRSSNERSDDRRSTGLGLAITKAIVEAHNGTINVESTRGVGSCFTVKIPA